jgi:riboflavin synthase alpha subunit
VFTGIVERLGTIARLERSGERVDLVVEVGADLAGDTGVGDSVALDGCCLTVTGREGSRLSFQAVPETLARTTLGERRAGDRLHVERALRADARLGGHLVQGHVDGVGTVREIARDGDDVRVRIDCAAGLAELLVSKGSVAVAGVSLTVVAPDARGFSVALIPHTLAVTTLGERRPGDRLNLEVDVIGKYVHEYLLRLAVRPGGAGGGGSPERQTR